MDFAKRVVGLGNFSKIAKSCENQKQWKLSLFIVVYFNGIPYLCRQIEIRTF
jgi:hypothetical protein